MEDTPTYSLHESLGYQLSIAARIQEKRLEEGLKALGLTRTTWCVLLAVGMEGHRLPSEIANFVGIDRTATSRALRQMETADLIARHAGTSDRRTTSVALTSAGEQLMQRGVPLAIENNKRMLERLSGEEYALLTSLLKRIHDGEDVALNNF